MLKVNARNLGTVAVLSLQGQIIIGETESLREAVQSQSAEFGVSAVILDLGRVNIVDARGLGVMLELREETESKGIRFQLMNVTKWVSRVLEISRLDSVFQTAAGVEVFPEVSRNRRASAEALRSCA